MSNPIQAPRESIVAPAYPDGFFGLVPGFETLDDWKAHVKKRWGLNEVLEKIIKRKEGISVAPSVLMKPAVQAGLVFNEGFEKRLLALTRNNDLTFRIRTRAATDLKNALVDCCDDTDLYYSLNADGEVVQSTNRLASKAEVIHRTTTYFMVAGGTQWCMGRLAKALPEPTVGLSPVTAAEADAAYESCGFYHGSKTWTAMRTNPFDMDGYSELWPLVKAGQGHAVEINMNADLGHPYYEKAEDPDALARCLQMTQWMQTTFRGNAGTMYRDCLVSKPSAVLFVGKTKTDIYSREKILAQELRFYVVTPGHLKFYLGQATQPFGGAKTSLMDIYHQFKDDVSPLLEYATLSSDLAVRDRFWRTGRFLEYSKQLRSAQKMGLTGICPEVIIYALDNQLREYGWGYLHCGDDSFAVIMTSFLDGDTWRPRLVIFKLDMSNFDLTQRTPIMERIHLRLYEGLRMIDQDRAEVMAEVWRKKLVNFHSTACAYFTSLNASGIPLQSEVNDMVMDVFMQRLVKRVQVRHPMRIVAGRITYPLLAKASLVDHIREAAHGLGLVAKLEDYQQISYSYCVGNVADFDELVGDSAELYHFPLMNCFTEGGLRFSFLGYTFIGNSARGVTMGLAPGQPTPTFVTTYGPERDDRVSVVADLPRFCTNVLYGSTPWIKDRDAFECYDMQRLVGSLINIGSWSALQENGVNMSYFGNMIITYRQREVAAYARARARNPEFKNTGHVVRLVVGPEVESEDIGALNDIQIQSTEQLTLAANALRVRAAANRTVHIMQRIWDQASVPLPRTYAGVAEAGVAGREDPEELFAPSVPDTVAQVVRGMNAAEGSLERTVATQILEGSFGQALYEAPDALDWAEESGQTSLLEGMAARGPPTVPARLRAPTQANFGRPPPSVGITNPMSATGLPGGVPGSGGGGGGGSSATRRKKAQKKRAKARRNAADADAEATAEHFAQQRLEEQAELDQEAHDRFLDRVQEMRDRGARGGQ